MIQSGAAVAAAAAAAAAVIEELAQDAGLGAVMQWSVVTVSTTGLLTMSTAAPASALVAPRDCGRGGNRHIGNAADAAGVAELDCLMMYRYRCSNAHSRVLSALYYYYIGLPSPLDLHCLPLVQWR